MFSYFKPMYNRCLDTRPLNSRSETSNSGLSPVAEQDCLRSTYSITLMTVFLAMTKLL